MSEILTAQLTTLQAFADKHDLTFEGRGEVGFGRPCVGFTKCTGYIEYNAIKAPAYDAVWPSDAHMCVPPGVPDAYHKATCMSVLVDDDDYDTALRQLLIWVEAWEMSGIHLEQFATGYATGTVGALLHGTHGWAFRPGEAAPNG